MLGLIVERVTHMPLERYAQRTLFTPLGMRSTSFALGRVRGAHAHGYVPLNGGPPFPVAGGATEIDDDAIRRHLGDIEPLNGSAYGAAASLVSTAADLDRFFHALYTGRVIPRSLVTMMQATLPNENGLDYQSYGLGLEGTRTTRAEWRGAMAGPSTGTGRPSAPRETPAT